MEEAISGVGGEDVATIEVITVRVAAKVKFMKFSKRSIIFMASS
jgi:hypothetical protein